MEISESDGEGARATGMVAAADDELFDCLERTVGGGLCGDEGGLEILLPPSDDAGDGERSGAAEEP